jgi:hypothetical protein
MVNELSLQETAINTETELASRPVFETTDPDQWERLKSILQIPNQFASVEDAYEKLADDTRFKSGVIKAYNGARNAFFDKESKGMARITNPIATGFMIDAIGANNFLDIARSKKPKVRQQMFQALLNGDNDGLIDELLYDDQKQYDWESSLRESNDDMRMRSLLNVLFNKIKKSTRDNALFLALQDELSANKIGSSPEDVRAYALSIIRDRFSPKT